MKGETGGVCGCILDSSMKVPQPKKTQKLDKGFIRRNGRDLDLEGEHPSSRPRPERQGNEGERVEGGRETCLNDA